MSALPSGTVSFLFSDIEGSTMLVHRFGDRYNDILHQHQGLMRAAFGKNGGKVVNTEGDSFFVAFDRSADMVAAAVAAQRALAEYEWPEDAVVAVRMGLHTGEPTCNGDDYTGLDVHRAARIGAAAHGGQVLISEAVRVLAGNRLPENVTLRDFGEHRLKDLEKREHLFQLDIAGLRADFPPIRSLNNSPNNLPVQITQLIGREKELAQVFSLIGREDVRLLTLTGPGGAGKTLLALQTATALLGDFADGIYTIQLGTVTDAALVPAEIADALGVREAGGQSLLGRLTEHLREKRVLLLLDNVEQIRGIAKMISTIIETCPQVMVLVTSRSPLRVRGEYTFVVPPLAVPSSASAPSLETLLASPAVSLFVERAKAIKGEFEMDEKTTRAVADICSRLDGLPLAIELAAARVKLLSPQAMLARLIDQSGHLSLQILSGGTHDLPSRQQTIRGAIAWSYELLDDDLKRLFRHLSIFAGGCTLGMAEAICKKDGDSGTDVLDGIAALVDQSLLRQEEIAGETRISMLQTIREFGLEQLRSSGEEAAFQQTHAESFAALAEEAEEQRDGSDQTLWRESIEAEQDNFRAALNWSFENSPALALRIMAAVGEFWFLEGHWTELQAACERIAESAGNKDRLDWRARCAQYAGRCARMRGDAGNAEKLFEQSLKWSERSKSEIEIINSLHQLGSILLHDRARVADARVLFERAHKIACGLKDDRRLADSFFFLGVLATTESDFEKARENLEQASALCRSKGYRAGLAGCMSQLAVVEIAAGEYDRAATCVASALELDEKTKDKHSIAWDRFRRGQIARCRGEYTRAALDFEDCLEMFSGMNAPFGEAWCIYELGRVALATEEFHEANAYFERALAIFRALGSGNAWAALQMGSTAAHEGRFRTAGKLLQKSLTAFRECGPRSGLLRALAESARLARLQGDYETAQALVSESLELAGQIDSKVLAVAALQQAAYLAKSRGNHEVCARFLGKVDALREDMGSPIEPCNQAEYSGAVDNARTGLGEEVFSKLVRQGRIAPLSALFESVTPSAAPPSG